MVEDFRDKVEILFAKYDVPKDSRIGVYAVICLYPCITQNNPSESEIKTRLLTFREEGEVFVEGTTFLHIACILGDIEFVKFIQSIGIPISSLDYGQNNCLHYAAQYYRVRGCREYIDIIKYLLCNGVDYNQKNIKRTTPLDFLSGTQCQQEILDYIQLVQLR